MDIITYGYSADLEDTTERSTTIRVGSIGIKNTVMTFSSVTRINCMLDAGESITLSVFQSRWGVITKTSETQFTFDSKIQIGNDTVAGTTHFKDKNVQITFTDFDIVSYEKIIWVTDYCYFTLGTLLNENRKSTTEGVQIISQTDHYTPSWHQPAYIAIDDSAHSFFYSCSFIALDSNSILSYAYSGYGGETVMYNCYFEKFGVMNKDKAFNLIFVECSPSFLYEFPQGEQFFSYDGFRVLYTHFNYEFSAINLYSRGMTYMAYVSSFTGNGNFTNTDSDNWSFYFSGVCTGEIYRQYTFDLKVKYLNGSYIENANVTISNNYLEIENSYLTYSNGSILQQILRCGHYNQTGGNTIYNYNPYNLTITYGNLTYTTLFNITESISWEIAIGQQTTQAIEELKAIGLIIVVVTLGSCLITFVLYKREKKNDRY